MNSDWKIYTKTGDKGETSLIGGKRVPKYHVRIEAYGSLDELNSFIGLLRDQVSDETCVKELLRIQEILFVAESELATDPDSLPSKKLPFLSIEDIRKIEAEIDRMNAVLPELKHFVLPGGNPVASTAHICRTVCRRAERIVLQLSTQHPVDELILQFLNRLSDYFFVLARYILYQGGGSDIYWIARNQ